MRIARTPALLFVIFALLLFPACSGRDHGEEPESTARFEAPVPEVEESEPRRVVRPAASVRPPPAFPHGPHVEIRCGQCHTSIRGHASHGQIACAECHEGSEQAVRQGLTRADCLSCHHDAMQEKRCLDCHEPVGDRVVDRSIAMSVWSGARTRSLPFSHERHDRVDCATCHRQTPFLTPDRACSTCHERHHEADADCASCHQEPGPGVHDVDAHRTCGGSGCHSDPVVEALPPSRQVCLVCHQAQRDHRRGQDCAPCHSVRSGGTILTGSYADPWKGVHQ